MSRHWFLNSLTQIRGNHSPPHSDCDFFISYTWPWDQRKREAPILQIVFQFKLQVWNESKEFDLKWGARFLKPRMERKYRSKPTRLRGAGRSWNFFAKVIWCTFFFIMLLIFNSMSTGVSFTVEQVSQEMEGPCPPVWKVEGPQDAIMWCVQLWSSKTRN